MCILESTQGSQLNRSYYTDVGGLERLKPLVSTKIRMLDDIFRYFALQYKDNDIDFKLMVNGSIPYMVENVLGKDKLETIVGDILQNALIAVTTSDNIFRHRMCQAISWYIPSRNRGIPDTD